MENTNADIIQETKPKEIAVKQNKTAIIGFLFMLAGPAVLLLAVFLTNKFGRIPEIAANIISWAAAILPVIGIVISIISLVKWRKTGITGRALAIVTVIMCNPLFYLYYLIDCLIASSTLAGLSWM